MSATLKIWNSQKWKSMKSTTEPEMSRSMPLEIEPPRMPPRASSGAAHRPCAAVDEDVPGHDRRHHQVEEGELGEEAEGGPEFWM